MDIAKIEKLKVAELRTELQSRGLDTKGVKAVLVERLRVAIESGTPVGDSGGLCATPSRRSRRTRSMTRSPSPTPVKKPNLQPVIEELPDKADNNLSSEELNEDGENEEEKEEVLELSPRSSQEAELEEEESVKAEEDQRESADREVFPENGENSMEREEKVDSESENEPEVKAPPVEEKPKEIERTARRSNFKRSPTKSSSRSRSRSKSISSDRNTRNRSRSKSGSHDRITTNRSRSKSGSRDRITRNRPRSKSGSQDRIKRNRSRSKSGSHDRIKRNRSRSKSGSEDRIKRNRSKSGSHDPTIRNRSRSKSGSRDRITRNRSRSKSGSRDRLTRERSRSKSSLSRSPKRKRTSSPTKDTDDFVNEEDEPVIEDKQFGLSWFDSDIHLLIDPVTFCSAKPMPQDIFSLVWSGARANYGVREGKVCFEVRLAEETNVTQFKDEPYIRGLRCGFSSSKTGLMLGEEEFSFAYCETGKKATNGTFEDYGKPFELDDVIGCYLDLDSNPCTIQYTLNGNELGTAFEFDKSTLGEENALFPHILTKGYEIVVNFADSENLLVNIERPKREKKPVTVEPVEEKKRRPSTSTTEDNWEAEDDEESKDNNKKSDDTKAEDEKTKDSEKSNADEDGDEDMEDKSQDETKEESTQPTETEPENREPCIILSGYELIALIPEESYISGPQRPDSRKECEVYLLVGLPGSGKTHWANNHIKENPDKHYYVIGVDDLIAKMKVDGKSRKSVNKGNWDKVFEQCIQSLHSLEEIATKRRRNYILDQTNAFASAQRRKMKGFGDFKRIAVVCIPDEEELKRRIQLKTEAGSQNTIRDSTLNNLKASFTLPSIEFGWFDNIIYTDLKENEAKEEVKRYHEKASKIGDQPRDKRPRRDYRQREDRRRYDDRRHDDFRGSRWKGNHNDRRGGGGSGGGGGGGSRWGTPRGGSGQWRDDRNYGRNYDNRNNRYGSGSVSGGGGGGGGSGSSQNWSQNRNRYDDRFARSGGGKNRYDSYSSGSRDHRDRGGRDRNNDRDGGSRRESSYRPGSQRDFRSGHRDNRTEDSRGGFDRQKYSSNTESGYEYNKSGGTQISNTQGKWVQMESSDWNDQQQVQQQQQDYWGYGQSQHGYGNQSQWSINTADPRQQQWMNWYQSNSQQQQQGGMMQSSTNQQYWSQYSYPDQGMSSHSTGEGSSKK